MECEVKSFDLRDSIRCASFSFDAPASHLLKISDLLPSSKSVNPIEISLANPIGFTDFAYEVKEGSKSEIFRRLEHRMKIYYTPYDIVYYRLL